MFQDPEKIKAGNEQIAFSKFLTEVEAGRVVEVEIQGNNISGTLSDGSRGYIVQNTPIGSGWL